jgi:hypothetical protein
VGYAAAFQEIARQHGTTTTFKAYLQVDILHRKTRIAYQSMGVTLVDCPHSRDEQVADKVMIGESILRRSEVSFAYLVLLSSGYDALCAGKSNSRDFGRCNKR